MKVAAAYTDLWMLFVLRAWKDEFDRAMTTVGKVWVETKRFDSFAPPRTKCTARW